MESVAILERIEDSFNININDKELEYIHTVKDLCDCVLKRLGSEKSGSCISAYVFYQLRKIFVAEMGYEKSLINPKTNLNKLLPKNKRSEFIESFKNSTGLQIPGMAYTRVGGILVLSALLILFLSLFFLPKSLIFILIALVYLFIDRKAKMFETEFPEDIIDKYVRLIVTYNYRKLSDKSGSLKYQDAIKVIMTIISDETGTELAQIKLEDRLADIVVD